LKSVTVDGSIEIELSSTCLPESGELLKAFTQLIKQLWGAENSRINPIRVKVNTVLFTLIIIRVNDW
jgi:hypothetical protein